MTEAIATDEQQGPPPPPKCDICESTEHTTGNHNGSTPATAVVDDPPMSPDGNHNGSKVEP